MLKLGSLELGAVPRVAVGFTDDASASLVADAQSRGVDIAEIRVDQFSTHDPGHVEDVLGRFAGLPTIATIRTRSHGGAWDDSEDRRLSLFESVLPRVDAIDVELGATDILRWARQATRDANKLLIVSHHDFRGTPDLYSLEQISDDAIAAGADIVKIATTASTREDLHSLSNFALHNVEKNLIVIGMGGHGLITRLAMPAMGSLITFAYIGQPTAPGQLRFEEMFMHLRLFYPDFNQEKIAALGLMEGV